MGPFNFGLTKNRVKLPDRMRKFVQGPSDDELIQKVKDYTHYASYSTNIWGDSNNLQTLGQLREVPAMLKDPIIDSAIGFIMETAFQMNDDQEAMWVVSQHETIKKKLDEFHEAVNMQQVILTLGFNLLLWGNLPFKHFFNETGQFVNFTPIPDFTGVTPIVVSGKTLGFIVNGEFCYPYEFTYAQLEYLKNLGGIFKNNFVQISGSLNSNNNLDGVMGTDFQNEFIIAPSYLSTAARPWKNINIIEDALLLNRMDQSNYYRIVSVNVGGSVHSKSAIRTLNYFRNLFKKVRRVSYDASGMSSSGSGQEFEVIVPKTQNQGVEVTNVGGEVEVRAIKDLETQYNKLFAALKVQPSQIGFGEEQSNAIGETSGQSYDRRLARTCKSLVYSVQRAIRNFDYLYLRTRGYDVTFKDWKYGTVSLSSLEDQTRGETLEKAIENLKSIVEVFSTMQLPAYNKNYLVETVLGQPLSATGIDVQEVLKVPEGEEGSNPMLAAGDAAMAGGNDQMLLASMKFKNSCVSDMLDVMQNASIMDKDFIASARKSLDGVGGDKKMIASVVQKQGVVNFSVMDDLGFLLPEDTPVDLSGSVFVIDGEADSIVSDFDRAQKGAENMVTVDANCPIFIPSGVSFTVRDFNSAGVRALGKAYINSKGELILVDKSDIATLLHMRKSGLFSCLVSRLIEVP
jgi:hypothetical protein